MNTPCPSYETLAAFVVDAVAPAERHAVDEHLLACGSCVQFVRRAMHRMSLDAEVDAAVPASLAASVRPHAVREEERLPLEIARPVGQMGRMGSPAARGGADVIASLVEWFRGILSSLRSPMLVPAGLAVVAILVVANGPREGIRGSGDHVPEVQVMRVTAPVADVLEEPGLNSRELTELPKGSEVRVVGEEGRWYHVELEDGRAGWIDQASFE